MKLKQRIDKSEPYFVHIGYTLASEQVHRKKRGQGYKSKLKMRDCVKKRLDKLRKYWKMALK